MAEAKGVEDLWLRVEYQTLRLLPASGFVLFGVRTLTDPLRALRSVPRAAESLLARCRALGTEMAEYKGLGSPAVRGDVEALLLEMSAESAKAP